MASQKVLIPYDEYVTLKKFKEKYLDLKKRTVQSDEAFDALKNDQTGHGNISADLEKVVVDNENRLNSEPPQILNSQTVPEPVKDISKPIPGPQSHNKPMREKTEKKATC